MNMEKRFHINKAAGRVSECIARYSCPYGDLQTEHYSCEKEAWKAYEQSMTSQLFRNATVRSSMKHMDYPDITTALMRLSRERGLTVDSINAGVEFAGFLHDGQKRMARGQKRSLPYIEHPLRVSYRLVKAGVKDDDIVVSALLHDTVEDCSQVFVKRVMGKEVSFPEARNELSSFIANDFGDRVSEIVMDVTNDYVPYEERQSFTSERMISSYYRHVGEKIKDNPGATLVKMSDFIDNAGSLYESDAPGREAKIKRTAMKYQPCIELFHAEIDKDTMRDYLPALSIKGAHAKLNMIDRRLQSIVDKYKDVELP